MSAELEVVTAKAKAAIVALGEDPKVRAASLALKTVKDLGAIVCDSDEQMASLGTLRLAMRQGISRIETGMTDLFREQKMFEKLVREHFKTKAIEPLEKYVGSKGVTGEIDRALLAWDAEKQRRVNAERDRLAREAAETARLAEQERLRLEREAEAAREIQRQVEADLARGTDVPAEVLSAATAAAKAAEAAIDDAPPEFEVQTLVVQPERTVRSETVTTFIKRTLVATLEDRAEAMNMWADAFTFDDKAAVKLFDGDESNVRPADGQFVLMGGVRFTVITSISGKGR